MLGGEPRDWPHRRKQAEERRFGGFDFVQAMLHGF